MNKEEIKERIKQVKKDLKRYKSFKYYKDECIINANLLLKLLKDNLKEVV